MITRDLVQSLKAQYEHYKILHVNFKNQDFLFRSLTPKEYEYIINTFTGKFEQEDAVCNLTCLYPEGYEFSTCEIGVLPSVIAGYILKMSSLNNIEEIFDEYDSVKSVNNLYFQCMDLIKAFIGDYSYEDMEDWTWQHLLEMTVKAERVAKLKGFEYFIQRTEQKQEDEKEEPIINSIHDTRAVDNLLKNKVNPLIYYNQEIYSEIRANSQMISQPFIIGIGWNNKELLDGFRVQKTRKPV